MADGVF